MDLLTVVMHELGHELGLTDLPSATAAHALMAESLNTGLRRLPPAITPDLVTPWKTTAPRPLMAAASSSSILTATSAPTDAVFAAIGSSPHSSTSNHLGSTAMNAQSPSATIPPRVDSNLSALQTAPIAVSNPSSANTPPRKIAPAFDHVFKLLGQ